MALFNKLFGRKKDDAAPRNAPDLAAGDGTIESLRAGLPTKAVRAERAEEDIRIGLQLLFPAPLALNAHVLSKGLVGFHQSLANAILEIDAASASYGTPTGRARWGLHTVEFEGFNQKITPAVLENCVAQAPYAASIKEEARNHQAHVRLSYAGTHPSPLDRYVAVAAVAGAIAATGANVVLNENGHTSLPIDEILPSKISGDRLVYLRSLSIPGLYGGVVEMDIPGERGLWLRTHGCQLVRLPNIAILAANARESQRLRKVLVSVYDFLIDNQRRLEAGQSVRVSPESVLKFRHPGVTEFFLHDNSGVLVAEEAADSDNKPPAKSG